MQNRWIWPFELQEKLGEGAMGMVYRARCVTNERIVAVKILPPDVAENPTLVARFDREIGILKKLRHPHVVHCFGGVCEDKRRFYAMELVEGGSLSQLIARVGQLPWEDVVDYGQQIASALAFAHGEGVVHRDVKPANILLTSAGTAKLSDFGLAMVSSGTRLTNAGRTMGSLHYMAPEQIRGKPPMSPQTDLYALGCVLFEMLTGRTPFEGDTAAAVMHDHLRTPPPRVAALVPDCPGDLDRLVSDLLQKSPENRPASAEQVVQRLRRISPAASLMSETMAATKTQSPVLEADYSDGDLPRRSGWSVWPWLVAATLLLALVWTGQQWRQAIRERDAVEQMWLEAVASDQEEVRMLAFRALGQFGNHSPRAVQVLRESLDSTTAAVRREAAIALGKIGAPADGAVPTLRGLQKRDEDPEVRQYAGAAAEKIRTAPKSKSSRLPMLVFGLLACAAAVMGFYRWRSQAG